MAFPANPTNGQKVVHMGVRFVYSTATSTWKRDSNLVSDQIRVVTSGTQTAVVIDAPLYSNTTAVTSEAINADTAPASPGTWPNLTRYYVSNSGAGIDVGTEVVWIPTNHATLPASKGWRFAFYPSATIL